MSANEWGKNLILKEDLENISNEFSEQNFFKDSSVLVTGATGLIGSLLVRSLAFVNRVYDLNSQGIVSKGDPGRSLFRYYVHYYALTQNLTINNN